MRDRVGVVIVNWNAGARLAQCVASVAGIAGGATSLAGIVVVDNASDDGSADLLPPTRVPVQVIRNRKNRGFGAACNQGARLLTCEHLLFLNPDARLSRDGFRLTMEAMDSPRGQKVGIVGPKLVTDTGAVAKSCCRFPGLAHLVGELSGLDRLLGRWPLGYRMREFDHLSSREVDHVMGACYLVRREVFEQLGGFDERFFVYFEDLDFSRRARRAGWRCWFAAEGFAYHSGGGCSNRVLGRRLYYSWSSRILFARIHLGRLAGATVLVGTLFLEPWLRVIGAVLRLSPSMVRETLHGYQLLLGALLPPAWTRGRGRTSPDPPIGAGPVHG